MESLVRSRTALGVERSVLSCLVGLLFTACYQFVPSSRTVFPVGAPVAFELNDVGRVDLGRQIGQEVKEITGDVRSQDATGYTVSVHSLVYLNGKEDQWVGEAVVVKPEFVKSMLERRFSSGRTAAAVLAGAGLVGGVFLANNLNGSGDKTPGDPKPPPGGTSTRVYRWMFRIP
jgi:hypothetical protein